MKNDSNIKPNTCGSRAGRQIIPDQAKYKVLAAKSGCIFLIAMVLTMGCETYKKIPGRPDGMSLGASQDQHGGQTLFYETLNWNFD